MHCKGIKATRELGAKCVVRCRLGAHEHFAVHAANKTLQPSELTLDTSSSNAACMRFSFPPALLNLSSRLTLYLIITFWQLLVTPELPLHKLGPGSSWCAGSPSQQLSRTILDSTIEIGS